MRKLLVLLFAAVVAVAFTATNAAAQREVGTIVGTVYDPTGAVVPGATVNVVQVGTGSGRHATTGEAGGFRVPNLLPGVYEVSVEATGFAKWSRRVQITVGATVGVDAHLSVGSAVQIIEVAAEAGMSVNVVTQTLEQVIDSKKLLELPTFSRDPYTLATTAPNVVPGTGTATGTRGVGISINGQRAASTAILLDGATNTDDFRAIVGQSIPLDAVQEFSVITNNFSAEHGRASGGVVNVITKGGTNEYHGTAYWFGRYSNMASNSFVNNANALSKSVFVRNQFGYSVGGPVFKEKLFFFQSTEWVRVRSSDSVIRVVARPELIALANANTQSFFSTFGTRKPGMRVLSTYTKNGTTTMAVPGGSNVTICNATGPCASIATGTPMFDRVSYTVPTNSGGGDPQNTYQVVGRGDWVIGPRTTLYGRYALESQLFFPGSVNHSAWQGYDTGGTNYNNNIVVSLTHAFSPTLTSQSKVNFNRLNNLLPLGAQPSHPTLFFEASATRIAGEFSVHPGYSATAPGTGLPFGGPQNFGQVFQDMTFTRGRHSWRFGGAYTYIQDNRTFGAYQNPAATLGSNLVNAMDNFMNGLLLKFESAVDPQGKFPCQFVSISGQPCGRDLNFDRMITGTEIDPSGTVSLPVSQPSFSRSNRYHEFAFYAQDAWRITRNFTLNMGVRWEYFGVQHHKNPNLDSNYYDGVGGSIFEQIRAGGVSTAPNSAIKGLWKKDWNNFAPRLGFAWDLFGNGKTSMRGGWGIAYERNFGNVTFNVIQNPPAYAVIAVNAGVEFPTIPIPTSVAGPLAGSGVSVSLPPVSLRNVSALIQTAFAQFWSLSLEREVIRNVFVGIDYNGSRGHNLYSLEDPNRAGTGNVFLGLPCTGASPAPCRDRLTSFEVPNVTATAGTAPSPATVRFSRYSNLNRRGQLGNSLHNAMSVRVNVNNVANSGLTMTANYTWGHTFDNLSETFSTGVSGFVLGMTDPFNPKVDYGQAAFDLRHRFVLSAIWEVPFAKNTTGVLRRIAHGWQFTPIWTAQTGTPFTIFDCRARALDNPCARLVATTAVPTEGATTSTTISPARHVFLTIPSTSYTLYRHPLTNTGGFGPFPANMTPRNFFRGPNRWDLDFGIAKTTEITERFKLQFRSEFFNLFNHPNDQILLTSAQVPSSGDTRVPVLRDGRRQIQVALKLIF